MASRLMLTRYASDMDPAISGIDAIDEEVHGVDLDGTLGSLGLLMTGKAISGSNSIYSISA